MSAEGVPFVEPRPIGLDRRDVEWFEFLLSTLVPHLSFAGQEALRAIKDRLADLSGLRAEREEAFSKAMETP